MRASRLGLMLLLTLPVTAQEVGELTVGQAVWRPQATLTRQTLPNGRVREVPTDLFGLVLERDETIQIVFHSQGRLGLVVKALDQAPPEGDPPTTAVLAGGRSFEGRLKAGRYLLIVASDLPDDAGYLLAVTRPPTPTAALESLAKPAADGELPLLGRFRLARPVAGLDISPDGRWLAGWSGADAWLADLERCQVYDLPRLAGPLRRVAFAASGWSVMTVTPEGALLLSLPGLAPLARFNAQSGVKDAAFAGPHQRVVVMPGDGPVYISSPVEGDLAYLPGTKGGDGLVADGIGAVAIRSGETVTIYDAFARRAVGRSHWTEPPLALALQPGAPVLIGAAAGGSVVWRAGSAQPAASLPGARAVAAASSGVLALAAPEGVLLRRDNEAWPLEPKVPAAAVAFTFTGHRLAAATATGELLYWNTAKLLERPVPKDPLSQARLAYNEALQRMKTRDYEGALLGFQRSLTLLRELKAEGEVLEYTSLALLRASQTAYLSKAYEQSLSAAEELLAVSAKLPEGDLRKANLAMGWYRKGDALWELDRKEPAKEAYRTALELGLDGPSGEDARQKVGP